MAKYDLDVYGVGRYGPGVPVPFLPDITSGASLPGGPLGVRATVVNPDEVMVRWNQPPQSVFTLIRLVRSMAGPPAWEDDGEILLDAVMGSAVNYLDDGLASARRYYYGVFVFDSEVQKWLRGGYADALVPDASYDHGARMYNLLPGRYREADTSGQLQRFLGLLGFELDIARTEVAGLPKVWDMSEGNASAVPLLLRQFGIRPEPELGFGNQRQLLQNIAMLVGSKGSAECLRVLASSVTGWAASVTRGINLIADNLDAQQDGGLGHWRAGPLASIGYHAGDNTINSPNGKGLIVVTATGTGTAYARMSNTDTTTGAPVVAGTRYGARVLLRGIARATWLEFNWYDVHGNYISSTSGPLVTPNIADWTTEASVFATAPAGAWWAGISVAVTNVALGNVMYVSSAMVSAVPSATSMPKYQPARDARIEVSADRVNEVRNPRFAVDTQGWGVAASFDVTASGATKNRLTVDPPPPLDDAFCCEVVATGAGQGIWTWLPHLLNGSLYSSTLWVRLVSGAGQVKLVLRDTANNVVASSPLTGSTSWTALAAQLITGAQATDGQLSLVTTGACTFRFGAVLGERGDYGTYFDGSIATTTADYMWEGPVDNSRSHYYRNRTIRSYRFRQLLPRFLPTQQTATLLFAQPYSTTDPLYPGATTFPGYDTFPQG